MLTEKRFHFFSVKRDMPILFFVNCEGTVLFSVKRDLDPPLPPSFKANSTLFNDICSKDLSNRPTVNAQISAQLQMSAPPKTYNL